MEEDIQDLSIPTSHQDLPESLIRKFQDVAVQAVINPQVKHKSSATNPLPVMRDAASSPINFDDESIVREPDDNHHRLSVCNENPEGVTDVDTDDDWTDVDTDDDWTDVERSNSSSSWDDKDSSDDECFDDDETKFKTTCLQTTRRLVANNLKEYLGIPPHAAKIIEYLTSQLKYQQGHGKLTVTDVVYIVLQKIRLNDSYSRLSHQYGVSKGKICQLFLTYAPIISNILKPLIKWPTNEQVRDRLPISFQSRYSRVVSVIDAFEIVIEKPADPFLQSSTWSEYYHANTFKYMISITPDGLINFISAGYGGRISDLDIVNICGYLDKLKAPMTVMADRGFKHVDAVLRAKDCFLLRPPSVGKDQILKKELTMEGKRIAATRIHVERAIGRVRDFHFIAPNACTDLKLVPVLDDAVIIACVLVNMQSPLIR